MGDRKVDKFGLDTAHKFGSIASDLLSSAYYVVVSTSPARTFASRKRNIASPSHVSAMGGQEEAFCASILCDRSDPTRLTGKEIKDEFGSLVNFVVSYGLKPYDLEDLKEALSISRSLKESREWHKRHGH